MCKRAGRCYMAIMAVMLANLYDALRAAGANDELAKKAAEEVAGYERQLGDIRAELSVLKWMVGTNIALTLIVLGLLLRSATG